MRVPERNTRSHSLTWYCGSLVRWPAGDCLDRIIWSKLRKWQLRFSIWQCSLWKQPCVTVKFGFKFWGQPIQLRTIRSVVLGLHFANCWSFSMRQWAVSVPNCVHGSSCIRDFQIRMSSTQVVQEFWNCQCNKVHQIRRVTVFNDSHQLKFCNWLTRLITVNVFDICWFMRMENWWNGLSYWHLLFYRLCCCVIVYANKFTVNFTSYHVWIKHDTR